MSEQLATLKSRWAEQPEVVRRYALPAGAIVLAVLYPFYVDLLPGFPVTSIAVVMLVFTMMALGLNIVVGYAGLFDIL